ncbi:MAG: Fur family transcriptional regulator [Phascolarctobacterium sp.]|nr:Fur family transcriptional regulator [Phascolarctobacterium sp.]
MLTSQELTILLRDNGYKVTPQRIAVYEALAEDPCHPTAEVLYKKLQAKYPAMSFATVYKTVEILEAIKAIQIINAGENSYRYDANVDEHYHLVCTECGCITDVQIDDALLEQLTNVAIGDSGFEITRRQFYFYGLCSKCRKLH